MDQTPQSTRQHTNSGFTVALCDDCSNNGESSTLAVLQETVRRSTHAVLIRAHCPLRRLWCHTRKGARTAGHVVLVQRCTTSRKPLGAAIVVGPVRTADDITALAHWLESTPLTASELPARLRQISTQRPHAMLN
jgi:hypothetical protein